MATSPKPAGRPVVRVAPIDAPGQQHKQRLGFLAGNIRAPEDFDRIGLEEICGRSPLRREGISDGLHE